MRLVIQRVSRAAVRVGDETIASIDLGFLILLGIHSSDDSSEAQRFAAKTAELRIFSDSEGRFNLSLADVGGSALVVSQFTLYADSRKGNRPSFDASAPPAAALSLYNKFLKIMKSEFFGTLQSGEFGADMKVSLLNDGPVTILIEKENDTAQLS